MNKSSTCSYFEEQMDEIPDDQQTERQLYTLSNDTFEDDEGGYLVGSSFEERNSLSSVEEDEYPHFPQIRNLSLINILSQVKVSLNRPNTIAQVCSAWATIDKRRDRPDADPSFEESPTDQCAQKRRRVGRVG
jgi:hypothetical protein